MNTIRENLERIQIEISRATQEAGSELAPTLIAATKFQPASKLETLLRLGVKDFGENYVQELLGKSAELESIAPESNPQWHFIGHLQTKKVKSLLAAIPSVIIHTLDSEKLAHEIQKRWERLGLSTPIRAFIEVNIDSEESKAGLPPDASVLQKFAAKAASMNAIQLLGLMCIPSPEADPRDSFRRLSELEKSCRPHTQGQLSMGMSSDFHEAIREGSTHIRIGTALVGPRPESKR